MLAASGGCLGIVSSTVTAQRSVARHPVVIDGELRIVDVCTGEVMKLPPGAVEAPGPFHPIEEDCDD